MSNKELIAEARRVPLGSKDWRLVHDLTRELEAAQGRIVELEEWQAGAYHSSESWSALIAERDALAARVTEVEDDNRALRRHAADKDRYAGECLLHQQELDATLDAVREWQLDSCLGTHDDERLDTILSGAGSSPTAEALAVAESTIAAVRKYVESLTDHFDYPVEAHHRAQLLAVLDSAPADHLNTVKAEAIHEAAEVVRRNCTAPSELTWPTVQIDALIAWVADWIENPPEWVHVSYRTKQGEQADR